MNVTDNNDFRYECGSSLIAPGVLLTAAHCVAKFQAQPGKLKVIVRKYHLMRIADLASISQWWIAPAKEGFWKMRSMIKCNLYEKCEN